MSIVIVLAMHGAPPMDFPKDELTEFFRLHVQMESVPEYVLSQIKPRYDDLEKKIRTWPRTLENDPFFVGAREMAEELSKVSGYEVILGFNEFCSPTLEEAIEKAGKRRPEKIIVITPMMTRGGEHAQMDIPRTIERVQSLSPGIPILYAWPFDLTDVAKFLLSQIYRFE